MKRNGNGSARTPARTCAQCGLNHSALGVQLEGDTLRRWVHSDRQVLDLGGGALGMIAALFDRHPEVTHFEAEIATETRREHVRADRAAFRRHSFRRDLGAGLQVVLKLRDWREIGDDASAPERETRCAPVLQLAFDLGAAGRARW